MTASARPTGAVPWRTAMETALYGPGGFYRRPEGPAGHFRTSVHASALFAAALLRLARSAGLDAVVDVGAGRGELLTALYRLDPGLRLHGVDLADRPADLPASIGWSDRVPDRSTALLVANEWLDNVPVDVVEATADGPRLVLVEPASGAERLGGPPPAGHRDWLAAWWPLPGADPPARAEVGWLRDAAWASAVGAMSRGLAVAVDYAHASGDRPPYGTLTGYRGGRQVPPVPDGTCDITAHVALDACAAAGTRAGATTTVLTTQRAALRALGMTGARPPLDLARTDPRGYLTALGTAGEAAELTDPAGLGGFGWLVQGVGVPVPEPLVGLLSRSGRRPG